LRLRAKLLLLIGLMFAGLVGLLGAALTAANRISVGGPIYETLSLHTELTRRLVLLRADLSEIRAMSADSRIGDDADRALVLQRSARTLMAAVDTDFDALLALASDTDVRVEIQAAHQTWQEFRDVNRETFEAPDATSRKLHHAFLRQDFRHERFEEQIDSAINTLTLKNRDLEDSARVSVRHSLLTLLGGGGALGLAVIGLTIVVAQSVAGPLRRLAASCERVASGHLTEKVALRRADEVGDLASAFNMMVDRVREELVRSRTAEARLTQIFDSTSDGILFVSAEGRAVSANRRAGELLGLGAERLGEATVLELLANGHPTRPAQGLAELRAAIQAPDTADDGDLTLVSGLTLRWSSLPARDGAGATVGVTLTFRDVTREREIDRMKSDFVSFVSHQLRTPLSGVKWALELVNEAGVPEEALEYVRDARGAADRLIRMVNELLGISRLESGQVVPVLVPTPLGELTSGVVKDLEILAREKGQRLAVTGVPTAPVVLADAELLRQVIANLVSNAIKYTPAAGSIDIAIIPGDGVVRWEVRDSGIGVPAADQMRLFQKFFRSDSAATLDPEGTGLGLYIARLVVEKLGGRVGCESTAGRGATFFFHLPLPPPAA
jgi:two-component system, OmpR family, phosphate regulon sensor histidine kinase PhoR